MPPTILLVDDSPTIRSIVKVYLMGAPVSVVEVDRADKALELIKQGGVDLVVADVRMPEMDGVTFVRVVRANPMPQINTLPIILLTGEKGDEVRQQAQEAGASAFINKPVNAKSLREAIGRFVPLG